MRIKAITVDAAGTITITPCYLLAKDIETVHNVPAAQLEVIIRKMRKRRSLDANAYLWTLCDKIASEIRAIKEDVYRQAVHDVGVFADVAVSDSKAKDISEAWEAHGIGWIAETMDHCKLPGCTKLRLYKGSSVYDTRQMSRLIDYIVEEAQGLGIETMTPAELATIKSEWE